MIQLDLQFFAGESTEKATPKKRQEAREKGQIVKSAELSSALTLLAAIGILKLESSYFIKTMVADLQRSLSSDLSLQLTPHNAVALFAHVTAEIGLLVSPVAGGVLAASILTNAIQTRGLFTLHPLLPDFNRINPLQGFTRIFSVRSLFELTKSLAKLAIVGLIIYSTLSSQVFSLNDLMSMQPLNMLDKIGSIVISVLWKVSFCLLGLGVADLLYQWFDYEKNLRMSKQDIKDEFKNTEGNPLIKGKIRERQRAFAARRMMRDVPKADVVITNPTHFAVALQYEAGMGAPVVLAKGADEVAQNIKKLAREHGIALVENKPLAQSLYKAVDIGAEIPADLFQAVAEVLAYVYRLKRRA